MSDTADELFDTQALLAGFGRRWPWAVFVYGSFRDDARANREFLRGLPGALGLDHGPTPVSALQDRRRDEAFDAAYNLAFTFGGLARLGIAPDILYSFPADFVEGMRSRADINHDTGRSAPTFWEEHWRSRQVDYWIGIYARSEERRDAQHGLLRTYLQACGMPEAAFDLAHRFVAGDTPVWIDDPADQPEPDRPLEHFGFQDGVSNPPVKGLAPAGPRADFGGGRLDRNGTWNPMAAGEFLHGNLDEIGEIPLGPTPASIAANGTFMVLRKLSQDVDAFRSYLRQAAERHGVPADQLAQKMVGRKRDGTPLVEPTSGRPRRDFVYAGDPDGMMCPLGSHVRRVNPRDSLGFATLLVDRHRMLRRGIPYGKLVPRERSQDEINPPDQVDGLDGPLPGQGLLFIALNVDITRQFEFVQNQWVNFGNDLDQGSDRDPIAGGHNTVEPRRNRMVILTESDPAVMVLPEIPSFVETRGGDYFFLPGIGALQAIIEGDEYS